MMKLAGVVITFFPDIPELQKNINSYIDDLDFLVIWENTPIDKRNYKEDDLKNISDKVIVMGVGSNLGIGAALNQSIWHLLDYDCDYFVTFDQDSSFDFGVLNQYKKLVTENNQEEIGVFGTNYISNDSLAYSGDFDSLVVNECITSGSIFPKTNFIKGHFFNEDFFIDAVDFEYCYRIAKTSGLSTVIFPKIILNHNIGYSDQSFVSKLSDNYSAFRTFFLIKNQIYIWRKYPDLFEFKRKIHLVIKYITLRIISVVFFERDKYAKLKSIIRGINQGLSKP